jgi:hypothetical protein
MRPRNYYTITNVGNTAVCARVSYVCGAAWLCCPRSASVAPMEYRCHGRTNAQLVHNLAQAGIVSAPSPPPPPPPPSTEVSEW